MGFRVRLEHEARRIAAKFILCSLAYSKPDGTSIKLEMTQDGVFLLVMRVRFMATTRKRMFTLLAIEGIAY